MTPWCGGTPMTSPLNPWDPLDVPLTTGILEVLDPYLSPFPLALWTPKTPETSPLTPFDPLNNPLFLQQINWIYGLKSSINSRTCPGHLVLFQRTWVVNGEGIRKRCGWCDFDVIAPQRLEQTFATKLVSANCCTKHANFVNPLVLRIKCKISKNVSSFSHLDLQTIFLPSREPILELLFCVSM